MKKNSILEYTLLTLALLVERYNSGKMDFKEFCSHIQIKVEFIKNNIESFQPLEKKAVALEVLQKCNDILIQQPSQNSYNT